jgi:hypothetical protein
VPADQPVAYSGGLRLRTFGVTGLDADDCWAILREILGDELPAVRTAVWDIDISTLGTRVPNGNPAARGVWYAGPR